MILGAPGRHASVSAYAHVADRYATKGTAALGIADTGQAWWLVENEATARLSVIGGKLTNATTAAAVRAGYIVTDIGASVRYIGGRFTLSPTSNPNGGGAVFVIWRWLLHGVLVIPDSPLHLITTDSAWAFGVWQTQVLSLVAGGTFAVPLATDSATIHYLNVSITGASATLSLPDGTTTVVTDSRIASLAGPYACFEVYQGNAATDTKAAFTEVWASDGLPTAGGDAPRANASAPLPE
jgi:hypothetical protein